MIQTFMAMARVSSPASERETAIAQNNFKAFRQSPKGANHFQDEGESVRPVAATSADATPGDKLALSRRVSAIEAAADAENPHGLIIQGFTIEGADKITAYIEDYKRQLTEMSGHFPKRAETWPFGRDTELLDYLSEIETWAKDPKRPGPDWAYSGRNYSVTSYLFDLWKTHRQEALGHPYFARNLRYDMIEEALPPLKFVGDVGSLMLGDRPVPVYVDYLYEKDSFGKPVLSVFFRAYSKKPRFRRPKKRILEHLKNLVPDLPHAPPDLAPVPVPGRR